MTSCQQQVARPTQKECCISFDSPYYHTGTCANHQLSDLQEDQKLPGLQGLRLQQGSSRILIEMLMTKSKGLDTHSEPKPDAVEPPPEFPPLYLFLPTVFRLPSALYMLKGTANKQSQELFWGHNEGVFRQTVRYFVSKVKRQTVNSVSTCQILCRARALKMLTTRPKLERGTSRCTKGCKCTYGLRDGPWQPKKCTTLQHLVKFCTV